MKIEPGARMRARPLGACPKCGKDIAVTLDENGDAIGVAHMQPMCSEYENRDPLDYAQYVNRMRSSS